MKIKFPLQYFTTFAAAINDNEGTITFSKGLIPRVNSAICNALVPFIDVMQNSFLVRLIIFFQIFIIWTVC